MGLGDQLCRGQAPLRRALTPTLPVHWSSEEAVAKLLPACHLGRLYLGRTKTGPDGALDLEEEEHGGGRASGSPRLCTIGIIPVIYLVEEHASSKTTFLLGIDSRFCT